jgi:predicted permease
VLPALRAAHVDPAQPLRDGAAANVGGGRRGQWLRSAMLSAQSAVALALLALAGLLGQSVVTGQRFDLGFDSRGLVVATANVSALGLDDAQSVAFHRDAMARIAALPGAAEVSAAAVVPLGSGEESRSVTIDGYTPPDGSSSLSLDTNVVWPGYFERMRIPLLSGRGFADGDAAQGAPLVAVVNQTMARRYWPSSDPVGRTMRMVTGPPITVVGVVRDIAYYALGEAPRPFLYLAYGFGEPFPDGLTFQVRTAIDPAVMARQMTGALRAKDARVRVANAMAYEDLRAAALFPARALGWLSVGFALPALALFLVGTYGVTAYVVAGRRRELALRVALGAAPAQLRADVVKRAVRWALPGTLAGVTLAVATAQLLRGTLVGVTTLDPVSLALAALAVLATLAAAAYVPARRVGHSDVALDLRT